MGREYRNFNPCRRGMPIMTANLRFDEVIK